MKLIPIIKITSKGKFDNKYLEEIGFQVATTISGRPELVDGYEVISHICILNVINYSLVEPIEPINKFIKKYRIAIKKLIDYEYTKRISFIFECEDYNYPELITIEDEPRLQEIRKEYRIEKIIIHKINPNLDGRNFLIEVNWKEDDLNKRHYAQEVLNKALESEGYGSCEGGDIGINSPDMSVFLNIDKDKKDEAVELVNQVLLSNSKLEGYKIIIKW